tara:strand:- start:115 stop:429 length:315 start_codon:yes stop_codon:yes gene_type:complete
MVETNKQKFNKRYKQPLSTSNSLSDIAKLSGISKSILQQVYNRGVGAWKNNPGSVRNVKGVKGGPGKKMSKEQWAIARVYSFVMGGKTRTTTDKDLWAKHKSKK